MGSNGVENVEFTTCADTFAFDTGVNPLPPEHNKLWCLEENLPKNQAFDASNNFEMDELSSHLAGGSLLKDTFIMQPADFIQATRNNSSPENNVGTSLNIGFGKFVEKATKGAKNTYSPQLLKWFVNFRQPCTVGFSSNISPLKGLMLRASPIFLDPAFRGQPISRCSTHTESNLISGEHIIVVTSPSV